METVFSQREIIKNWRWWKKYRSWDSLSCGSMMNAKVSSSEAFVWTLCHLFLVCVEAKSKPYEWTMKWDESKRILSCIQWKVFLYSFGEVRQTFSSSPSRSYLLVQDIQINLLNTRLKRKEIRWRNINFHSDDGFFTKGMEKSSRRIIKIAAWAAEQGRGEQQKISKSGLRLKRSRKLLVCIWTISQLRCKAEVIRLSPTIWDACKLHCFPATWQISLGTLVRDVNWRIKLTVKVEWKFEILSSKCSVLRQVC